MKKELPDLRFWVSPDCDDVLLAFVKLPALNEKIVCGLLTLYDELYGSTNQDLSDWASEYQLLTRMLLHHGYLLINPKFLDLTECSAQIIKALGFPENEAAFRAVFTLTPEDVREIFTGKSEFCDINAEEVAFVAVWDGGARLELPCKVNPRTKEVSNVFNGELDGTEYPIFSAENREDD